MIKWLKSKKIYDQLEGSIMKDESTFRVLDASKLIPPDAMDLVHRYFVAYLLLNLLE
jgi:hypothetical protein